MVDIPTPVCLVEVNSRGTARRLAHAHRLGSRIRVARRLASAREFGFAPRPCAPAPRGRPRWSRERIGGKTAMRRTPAKRPYDSMRCLTTNTDNVIKQSRAYLMWKR